MKIFLLDIEGTTTDINFVHKVLFPYAKKAMPQFLSEHKNDEAVKKILSSIVTNYSAKSDSEILELLIHWIDTDQKIKELKDLQGLIWLEGYHRGDYVAHLYHDVVSQMKHWKESGCGVYIYSSGSVKAQKLLFEHTENGDITNLIDGYFDTTVGNKRDEHSYLNILKELKCEANKVTFLSDIAEELEATSKAGMNVVHVNRDNLYNDSKFKLINEFGEMRK